MLKTIFAVLILLLSAGCAVEPDDIASAEKICSDFGGIKYLYAFPRIEVTCNNGLSAKNLKFGG